MERSRGGRQKGCLRSLAGSHAIGIKGAQRSEDSLLLKGSEGEEAIQGHFWERREGGKKGTAEIIETQNRLDDRRQRVIENQGKGNIF